MNEQALERYRELINDLYRCDEREINFIINEWKRENPYLWVDNMKTKLKVYLRKQLNRWEGMVA